MAKYRVVRGNLKIGKTHDADSAREAVEKDQKEVEAICGKTYGGIIGASAPAPVIEVYELTLVDPSLWR